MSIKIFHTADLHIGMKFSSYPEPIKSYLQQARVEVLSNMVQIANQEKCNLFVIAGDLFDRITGIDKKTINMVATSLKSFQGDCVLVMPGNHDYDNGMIDLWTSFNKDISEKILYINEERPYSLDDYGINATIYPAPCHSKHSSVNNIGWINDETLNKEQLNIGIGHGAITGLSPDMDCSYYNMTIEELQNTNIDLWLLGHTHISYPLQPSVIEEKIFNPGTPEPDGLDCRHKGNSWIISIDDNKKVVAERVITGTYKFVDKEFDISDREKEEMKELILTAAANIIAAEGIDKLSIRKIASNIEYSPSIVYHYFKDKDEILNIVMQRGYKKIIMAVSESIGGEDPKERLKEMTINYINAALMMPDEFMAAQINKTPEALKHTASLFKGASSEKPALRALSQCLEELYKNQNIDKETIELTAQIIAVSTLGLIIKLILEKDIGEVQRKKLIEFYTNEIVLRIANIN